MLTVREVAKQLQLGRRTVQRLIRTGALQAVKCGANRIGYRIEPEEVARFRREGVPT
jgi:excisionase family DNA binding protein